MDCLTRMQHTDTDLANKIDKDRPPTIICEHQNYSDTIPVIITEAVAEHSGLGHCVDAQFASKLADDNHLPTTAYELTEKKINTNKADVSEDMQEQNKENNFDRDSIDVLNAAEKREATENTVTKFSDENLLVTVYQPVENKSIASKGMQEQTEYSETNFCSSSDNIENTDKEILATAISDVLENETKIEGTAFEDILENFVFRYDENKISSSVNPNNSDYFNNVMEKNESAIDFNSLEETYVDITDFMNVNNDGSTNTEVMHEAKIEDEGNISLFEDTVADTEYSYEYMYNFLKPQQGYSQHHREVQNKDQMKTETNLIDIENDNIEHKTLNTFADFDDLIQQFVVKAPEFGDLGLMNQNPFETVNQLPMIDISNAHDTIIENEDTPLRQIVSTVSISSEESINNENVQEFEIPIVDTISIRTEENYITTMNAEQVIILMDSEDNDNDSDYCSGYHSSDFEFISESEAKKEGLVIKKKNRSKLRIQEISIYDANQHSNRHVAPYRRIFAQFPSLNQGNHEIPEGDEYLRLFQGGYPPAIPINFHIMENKAITVVPPNGGMAVGDAFGFDLRELSNRSKETFHFDEETINDARATESRIREMYPGDNITRPRRKQCYRPKRYF